MAIYVVPGVDLKGQDMTNACWWFSAKMVHAWGVKNGKSINDPELVKVLPPLYIGNCGWAPKTCKTMAEHLGLNAMSRSNRGFNEMLTLLKLGPIWTSGLKTSGGEKYSHVVVIAGVADTGVLVLDPQPMKQGSRSWKTWDWLNSFLALDSDEIDANLLVFK